MGLISWLFGENNLSPMEKFQKDSENNRGNKTIIEKPLSMGSGGECSGLHINFFDPTEEELDELIKDFKEHPEKYPDEISIDEQRKKVYVGPICINVQNPRKE